jgi:hypothetical protein
VRGVSCRIKDREVITHVPCDVTTPLDVAEQVVNVLEAAAPDIRLRQRTRIRHMLGMGGYRAYLAGRRDLLTASASIRRQIEDPFEFASLTELQRDELAVQLRAMTRADHDLLPLLGREAMAGLSAYLSSPEAPTQSAGTLLRAGLREMARFADEPFKAARPFVWNEEGWRRMMERL